MSFDITNQVKESIVMYHEINPPAHHDHFYCRVCCHEYIMTTVDKHVKSAGHLNQWFKSKGSLL